MKKYFLLILALAALSCAKNNDPEDTTDDTIEYPKKVFFDYIVLSTQEEVDDFGDENYTRLTGNLELSTLDPNPSDPITNVDALNSINTLDARLILRNLDQLNNIDGLSNLTTIHGALQFDNCSAFLNMDSFENITTVGTFLTIQDCIQLQNIDGLSGLTSIGNFEIWGCPNVTSLAGLSNVTNLGGISISNMESLPNLNGLHNVQNTQMGKLILRDLDLITTIGVFQSVETVTNFLIIDRNDLLNDISDINVQSTAKLEIRINTSLNSLDGLESIQSVTEELKVISNAQLDDLCALESLIQNGGLTGSYIVNNNFYNPTQQDIIDGNCSL